MSEVLRAIAGAMQSDVAALRAIGQNIANAEVPAYRRQIPLAPGSSAATFEELLAAPVNTSGFEAQFDAVATDPTPGVLKSTGESLHLALEGAGYFSLQSEHGTLLSRRGDFHVSAEGILTAASGEPVLGSKGPIEIGTAVPRIDADGTVHIGNDVIDTLSIVTVAPTADMRYVGNALYALADAEAIALEQPSVRQGFLEAGNVTPVQEMVQLMETLRHFETAQKFLLGYDQLQQRAISEMGRVDL